MQRHLVSFNPIKDSEGENLLQAFLVGISYQNILTFTFNTFTTLVCEISRSYLVPVPNYWTWNKITPPQKKWSFWSNPYKIEVKITCLIEMLC